MRLKTLLLFRVRSFTACLNLERLGGFILAVALLGGCATHEHRESPLAKEEGIVAAELPFFLTGPASVLLTNQNDFHARIEAEPRGGITEPITGNLFQQEGKLLFIPTRDLNALSTSWSGSFRFLADVGARRGYIISEKLQAYATFNIATNYSAEITNLPGESVQNERINDQPCQIDNVAVRAAGQREMPFRVWSALELNRLPLQIRSVADTNGAVIRLSQAEAEAQAPDLFMPPGGYMQYSSSEALVKEMVRRQRLQQLSPNSSDSGRARRRSRY